MILPRLLCAGLVSSVLFIDASACSAHAEKTVSLVTPENWTKGPWLFAPARFADRFTEMTFVPFTEPRRVSTITQRGPRRLHRFHTAMSNRPNGDFTLARADGRSSVFSGTFRKVGDAYVRVDGEKDVYKGLSFVWSDDHLVMPPSEDARIRPYVGSTLRPLNETPLFAALRRGDHARLAEDAALSEKALVERDAAGRSLLYRAAELGDAATVKLLLERGVPVDQLNAPPLQRTPLAAAIHSGRFEIVEQLLDAGANPNHPDANGERPLHIAGEGSKIYAQLVRRLLAAGADPSLANNRGRTPRETLERAQATGYLTIFDREVAAAKSLGATARR